MQHARFNVKQQRKPGLVKIYIVSKTIDSITEMAIAQEQLVEGHPTARGGQQAARKAPSTTVAGSVGKRK